jgi:hypothetical protein
MHRLQRSPFGWLASFALASLASCTLTADGFEPGLTSTPPVEEETDPLEPLPAESVPGAEIDASEDPEVPRASESPPGPDVPLAPSTTSNEGNGASTPCLTGCDEETSDDEGEPDVVCAGGTCPEPPGAGCDAAEDCESGVCASGLCQASSCSDAFQNADEAGIDCGGSACVPCPCSYGAAEVLGDPNYAGNFLYSPSLSPDGLTLYFGLYLLGGPNETIAFSTRPSLAAPFGLGNLLPAPVNASLEGTPRLAADNLTLYFYSERAGGLGGRDIYRAQRAVPGGAFDVVTNLTEINSAGMDQLPWVSADGLAMYFSSDRAGDLDIHRATRASTTDPWQAPERIAELNTTAVDNGMTLTSDQREIVFASYRLGGSDFFRAVRAPGEAAFRPPEYLAAISSAADDTDPALSPDGSELYFSSTRDGTDSRIWRVSRTCP